MSERRFSSLLAALGLATVVLFVWGPLLWVPFLYDDGGELLNNPDITGPWLGFRHWLTASVPGSGSFEPINNLLHHWLWLLAADKPPLYRATSLALHWANAVLAYSLLKRFLRDPRVAFSLSILFAVFPSHVEVLAVSRFKKHLLVAFLGFLLFEAQRFATRRWAPAAGAGLLGLALLTRESALALPLLGLLLVFAERAKPVEALRREWRFWALQATVYAAFFFWRFFLLPTGLRPLIGGSWPIHLLTSGKIFLWYWKEALLPWPLCPESDLRSVAKVWSWQAAAVLIGALTCSFACAWSWFRDRLLSLGLLWFCLGLTPFLNIPSSLNLSLVADRYLYLAIPGLLLAAGRLIAKRPWKAALLVPLSLAWIWISMRQSVLYTNPLDLWTCVVGCAPGNPRAHTELGGELQARGLLSAATVEFERAVAVSPVVFLPTAQMLLASAYADAGRLGEAVTLAQKAARQNPTTAILSAYGVFQLRAGDLAGAEESLDKALAADPRNGDALLALGQLRDAQGRVAEAQALWRQAARLYPFRPRALTELGWLLLRENRPAVSEEAFREALAAEPFELRALDGLAELKARAGSREDGVKLYDDLLSGLETRRASFPDRAPARAQLDAAAARIRLRRDAFVSSGERTKK